MKTRLLTLLLLAALLGAAGLTVYVLHERARTIDRTTALICEKVDKLDDALIGIVARSARPPKPRPGQYGYDYWLHHPGERAHGSPGIANALTDLRKAACDPNHLRGG